MFQKKDIIFCETMGVCAVEDITKIPAANDETVSYYALSNVYEPSKRGYFPVETTNRLVVLRDLLPTARAKEKKEVIQSTTSDRSTHYSEAELEELRYVLEPANRPQLQQEKKSARMKSWRDLARNDA